VGKIGRFFIIGPREFGVHPTTKMIRLVNEFALETLGNMLQTEPVFK
jgi:hypothetical protein